MKEVTTNIQLDGSTVSYQDSQSNLNRSITMSARITPEIKKRRIKWVKALLSGRYKQTTGRLCRKDKNGPSYCCLGVACVTMRIRGKAWRDTVYFGGSAYDLGEFKEKLGMDVSMEARLISMNDGERKTLKQIGAYLKKIWRLKL